MLTWLLFKHPVDPKNWENIKTSLLPKSQIKLSQNFLVTSYNLMDEFFSE